MKKKRFMGLLALASCVTLLTGCESDALWGLGGYWNSFVEWGKGVIGIKDDKGEKESDVPSGEKQESEEEVQPKDEPVDPIVATLTVAELPYSIDVRESVDLDEYVTVFGVSGYTVTLDEESEAIASVDGHVITATGEGDIKFTVSAGEGLEEECSVVALSSDRLYLYSAFSAVGNKYAVLDLGQDEESGEIYVEAYTLHNPNYLVVSNWTRDDQGNMLPGGWLNFGDTDTFSFTYGEDAQGNPEVQNLEKSQKWFLDTYNPEIEALYYFNPSSESTYVYDEQNEQGYIALTGKHATWWAQDAMLCNGGEFEYETDVPVIDEATGEQAIDEETGEPLYEVITYTFTEVDFYVENVAKETEEPQYVISTVSYISDGTTDEETGELNEYVYSYSEIIVDPAECSDEYLDAFCADINNKPESTDYFNDYYGRPLTDYFLSAGSEAGAVGVLSVSYGWYDAQGNRLVVTDEETGEESYYVDSMLGYYAWNNGEVTVYTGERSAWILDASYNVASGRTQVEVEGEDIVFNVSSTLTGDYNIEPTDSLSIWDNGYTFAGLRDSENWVDGIISECGAYTDSIDYFVLDSEKVSGLFNAIAENVTGLAGAKAEVDLYASVGDLLSFFNVTMLVAPESGMVQLSFVMQYDQAGTMFYRIDVMMSANAQVAGLISSIEAEVNPLCLE